MSYVKPTAAQADWAQKRLPKVFRELAQFHADATAGLRDAAQNPQLEKVLDAVGTWRAAQGIIRHAADRQQAPEKTMRTGVAYAAGLAIMAGASSAPASGRLRMGREQLQRDIYRSFGPEGPVREPVRKARAA